MKSEYERTNLIITEFDKEDVISTSAVLPPSPFAKEKENAYGSFRDFDLPGNWF